MIDNKIRIQGDAVVDIQRGAIGHRATWTGLTYTKAREAGKAAEAEKIIREAIVETGKIQGAQIKTQCREPENVACFTETFLTPNVEKTFEIEFTNKTADRVDLEFHHCPLLKAWQDLGFDDATCEKLCDMAMDGDRSIAKAVGFEFYLGDTIAKGGKTCQMSYFKKGK
ncbi:l-2-amino-thiazoline-4-carboxylic acid hydrolase [Lucifera butyrica]|uniref:L-2-amino-thiazoline-4-carboxylic acid hydrolase n=1 Tax=Lucifera butyrica TaxID=1351585 RepID=A0A498RC12_9FIRM|nr:L-2-amino-thiazoline-4-carboxylic acid hydrolase [Lucifera butyrica]VBB09054.1 l-2-amino-thiazoline-4-carboxylic acid hydrolase [Lucifera butyrica]